MNIEELKKLDSKGREAKLKELKIALIKSRATAGSSKVKTKEIKKAIARLLTLANAEKIQHAKHK